MLYARRFSSDKIKSVQLISKYIGSKLYLAFVIQYNCTLLALSLNDPTYVRVFCDSKQMVRRFLTRGYNDHIYYAESNGLSDKLIKITMNPDEPSSVIKQEVFSLPSTQIVAFDIDCENYQNDAND